MHPYRTLTFIGTLTILATTTAIDISANDWPQWRGLDRLAIWHETGIVEDLPENLKVAWRTPIREGYSGPAVADGRVFITDWAEDEGSRTLDLSLIHI